MDEVSEAIQSYMIVVGLFWLSFFLRKSLKFFSWYQQFITACSHRYFYFYNTAEETWSETSFIVMKKGSHNLIHFAL